MFGNQTAIRLNYFAQLRRLQKQAAGRAEGSGDHIVLLSYRPGMEEPGPEKSFELSATAVAQRWNAGLQDMRHALNSGLGQDITVIRRPQLT
jgi:NTE family protein